MLRICLVKIQVLRKLESKENIEETKMQKLLLVKKTKIIYICSK